MKKILATAVFIALVTPFGIESASGDSRQDISKSTVSIAYDRDDSDRRMIEFSGSVGSRIGLCEARRRVVVKQSRRGADPVLAVDFTNQRGRWETKRAEVNADLVYAEVEPVRRFESPRSVQCLGASTRVIDIGGSD